MCNLYSVAKGQAAIVKLTRAMIDRTGNLPPLPGIFPDYGAPIVREGQDGRELALARWGMPSPGGKTVSMIADRPAAVRRRDENRDVAPDARIRAGGGVQ
jgi:putative SOS response-associated peptidase YedK